ncbi:hypothetical protein V1478_004553 [Vespula squamosa]|uniref:Uncharacterized protein n=1 Tax=Vespula squamosa TaxID=30214 RepID=A0ABD2BGT8_VESSQ
MLRSTIKTILLGGIHPSHHLMPIKMSSSHFLYTYQKAIVQTKMEQKRYYKNFGHKREQMDRHSYLIIICGIALAYTISDLMEFPRKKLKFPKVDAADLLHENDKGEDKNTDTTEQDDQKKKKGKKEKTGFRDRKVE